MGVAAENRGGDVDEDKAACWTGPRSRQPSSGRVMLCDRKMARLASDSWKSRGCVERPPEWGLWAYLRQRLALVAL
jgi:hypothetical protein